MQKHLRKLLRLPYHRIYIQRENGYHWQRMTKTYIRSNLKNRFFIDRVIEINTHHNMNYSTITLKR